VYAASNSSRVVSRPNSTLPKKRTVSWSKVRASAVATDLMLVWSGATP